MIAARLAGAIERRLRVDVAGVEPPPAGVPGEGWKRGDDIGVDERHAPQAGAEFVHARVVRDRAREIAGRQRDVVGPPERVEFRGGGAAGAPQETSAGRGVGIAGSLLHPAADIEMQPRHDAYAPADGARLDPGAGRATLGESL